MTLLNVDILGPVLPVIERDAWSAQETKGNRMSYKNDLIASIEGCLSTLQNCRYKDDPVIKTMKDRISSIKRTLATARAVSENDIINVLNGMNKEATSLVSNYLERVAQVERQKFDQRSKCFRTLEICLLIASTLIAGTAAYRSIANAEELLIISNRQIKISESQLEIPKNQTSTNSTLEIKIRELEEQIKKINQRKNRIVICEIRVHTLDVVDAKMFFKVDHELKGRTA